MENKEQIYEGHGNNWQAIRDFDEASLFVDVAKVVCEDDNSLVKYKDGFFCMIGFEPPIRALALCRADSERHANTLESLYPFFQVGNPVEVEILKIVEWSSGKEAIIEGVVGEASLAFFDAFYFLNKSKYKIGGSYLFNIAGLAHTFEKRTKDLTFVLEDGPTRGETHDTTRMTGFITSDEYGGEFTFYHPFTSFDGKIEAFNTNIFRCQFYLMSADADNGAVFSFPLYVPENVLKGYKPELNDPIFGTGWLQGYLVDTLRT